MWFLLQHRNFTVVVQPHETIARVRAQLLHILFDIGKEDFQFRLRYHGQYLRDAYTVSDYALMENALIKMVPLTGREGHDVSQEAGFSYMASDWLAAVLPANQKPGLKSLV